MLQLVFKLRKTLDYPFAFFLLRFLFSPGRGPVDIVNGAGLAILSIIFILSLSEFIPLSQAIGLGRKCKRMMFCRTSCTVLDPCQYPIVDILENHSLRVLVSCSILSVSVTVHEFAKTIVMERRLYARL